MILLRLMREIRMHMMKVVQRPRENGRKAADRILDYCRKIRDRIPQVVGRVRSL